MSLLKLKDVAKNFGAIEALKGVDLEIGAGEVVGLMGDNGAGKSTLVKIISGNFRQSRGSIEMDGELVDFHRPMDARDVGIEVVYQDLAIADNLTAAENVFLGREIRKGWGPFKTLDRKAMIDRSAELFEELKSETRPRDLVRKMSGGQRQAVAIARTRLSKAKIVLMDEPTAAISVRQVAEVLSLIKRLKAQGVAIVLISHRMPDVFGVCDRIVELLDLYPTALKLAGLPPAAHTEGRSLPPPAAPAGPARSRQTDPARCAESTRGCPSRRDRRGAEPRPSPCPPIRCR